MTDRKTAIAERVREDLHDHLEDFKRHGPSYISDYIDAVLTGRLTRPTSHRLHPKIAAFVRDIVLDAAMVERRPTPDLFAKSCGAAPANGTEPESPRERVAA